MPKIVKGYEARRPPEPVADHSVIDDWIAGVMPAIHPLVRGIDDLICRIIPGLQFAVKWSKAHYGTAGLGWIIEVAAYHKSANVVFFAGADMEPAPPLGDTGRARYIKLYGLDELEDPAIRTWIEQAATLPGWR
ncbi:MAG: DUF1801 domain-containing protein [Acidimicrobiales bacterium]|nr:DUF1801 domain-containing protein [Acidimicrobiales bacterium]